TALLMVDGFWPIFAVHAVFCLAFVAVIPLQDGLTFQVQAQRGDAGRPVEPYHRVRVWGTVGFILPSLLLYAVLAWGAPIGATLAVGAAFALVGMINALYLPRTRSVPRGDAAGSEVPLTENDKPDARQNKQASRLPTVDALHAMLRPHVLVFCAALFLVHIASAAYYAFYPLYLTEQVGIASQWVGLIANIGVTVEVFFLLGFGLLLSRLGIRWLLTLGMVAMAARMVLLYAWPSIGVAVATQVFHGLHVLVIHVIPPIFLNRQADARYRNSIHGLYAISVYGTGRILGAALAGVVADTSLLAVFAYSSLMCAVAGLLFALLYRDPPAAAEPATR
ncbi:MAG: MFS transporter, partial [Phycisphaeraceae bacterium]